MLNKFLDFSEKFNMLPEDGFVLAAVSGGADSMCLLSLLLKAGEKKGFSVGAMHFNHLLRGEESDRDEEFVKSFCLEKGIPFFAGRGDVKLSAEKEGESTEEAARRLRYDFFYKTAKEENAVRIATAHSADDNAETILMRIARGTGLKGLTGIPPVRGNIIRPLLFAQRDEIEEYLLKNGISHVEDSTNREDIYTRNVIRHHVMPVMKSINPEFSQAVSNLIKTAGEDERYLSGLAESFVNSLPEKNEADVNELRKLPKPVFSRVMRIMGGMGLSSLHIQKLWELTVSDDTSGEISLPKIKAYRQYELLIFGKREEAGEYEYELPIGKSVYIAETGVTVSCEEAAFEENPGIYKSFNTFIFEKEKIYGKLIVRQRRTGDKITLRGRNVTKSLKKLFIEERIPTEKRNKLPLVCDDGGVLCVCGVGADVRGLPQRGTKIIKITFKEKAQNAERY